MDATYLRAVIIRPSWFAWIGDNFHGMRRAAILTDQRRRIRGASDQTECKYGDALIGLPTREFGRAENVIGEVCTPPDQVERITHGQFPTVSGKT